MHQTQLGGHRFADDYSACGAQLPNDGRVHDGPSASKQFGTMLWRKIDGVDDVPYSHGDSVQRT
jgi:hypothetical protein